MEEKTTKRGYSDAQNKATQKYIKKAYDAFTIRVPKGEREKYKLFAENHGSSLNGLIIDLLEEEKLIFKSYSRKLIRDLKDIKEALKNKKYEKAEKLIDDLIEDTQKDIEY